MQSKRTILILGGGTAGWMCAAALSPLIRTGRFAVHLIESDQIGTVGVGEATLPHMKTFNDALGIDEAAFMRATNATFKLGIQFDGWGKSPYIHPFGRFGQDWGGIGFQHHWRRGGMDHPLADYSFAVAAAEACKFAFPDTDPASVRSTFSYAYHFDAALYARFMRDLATSRGVVRTEGRVVDVALDPERGTVRSLTLESGATLAADLFIDCSGFAGLLIGKVSPGDWQDWNALLPCDRAWAVPDALAQGLPPYTRATTREAGWQWRIPLQNRTGNGYVFSTAFTSEQAALDTLLANLASPPLAEPRLLRFKAGRRTRSWVGNVVAMGLASGFLEPLESTSIYLVQAAIQHLVPLLNSGFDDGRTQSVFNRLIEAEYDPVRDFLVLHYRATARTEPLWQYTRAMPVPDSLTERMALFRHRGHIEAYSVGLFSPPSWLAVYVGQDVVPDGHDRTADALPADMLARRLTSLRSHIAAEVAAMDSHDAIVRGYVAERERAVS